MQKHSNTDKAELLFGREAHTSSTICYNAVLAQSVARRLGKAEVGGSSPLDSFKKNREIKSF